MNLPSRPTLDLRSESKNESKPRGAGESSGRGASVQRPAKVAKRDPSLKYLNKTSEERHDLIKQFETDIATSLELLEQSFVKTSGLLASIRSVVEEKPECTDEDSEIFSENTYAKIGDPAFKQATSTACRDVVLSTQRFQRHYFSADSAHSVTEQIFELETVEIPKSHVLISELMFEYTQKLYQQELSIKNDLALKMVSEIDVFGKDEKEMNQYKFEISKADAQDMSFLELDEARGKEFMAYLQKMKLEKLRLKIQDEIYLKKLKSLSSDSEKWAQRKNKLAKFLHTDLAKVVGEIDKVNRADNGA